MENIQTMYHIMLGVPESGKGYVGEKLKEKFELKIFSSGDMFRKMAKDGMLPEEYCDMMKTGDLIPNDVAIPLILDELSKDCWQGGHVMLDGFPRDIIQVIALERMLEQNDTLTMGTCLYLNCEDRYDAIRSRVVNRLACPTPGCRGSYNKITNKPKVDGVCDICHSKLFTREDDKPEVYDHRMMVFNDNTYGVVEYYRCCERLNDVDMDNHVAFCSDVLEEYGVPKRM